jgi:hypothetical protein
MIAFSKAIGIPNTRGGQTRVTRIEPTDPYGSVFSGRVAMGGTGPAGTH